MQEKHLEIGTYNSNGINVTVQINYDNGTLSLVDGNPAGNFMFKNYVFRKGDQKQILVWLDVLDAMKKALSDASLELAAGTKKE